jgi:hypothetical protein
VLGRQTLLDGALRLVQPSPRPVQTDGTTLPRAEHATPRSAGCVITALAMGGQLGGRLDDACRQHGQRLQILRGRGRPTGPTRMDASNRTINNNLAICVATQTTKNGRNPHGCWATARSETKGSDQRQEVAAGLPERSLAGLAHLTLQVIWQSNLREKVDLGLQDVDVLFGVFQNALQDFARDIVSNALAVRYAFLDGGLGCRRSR